MQPNEVIDKLKDYYQVYITDEDIRIFSKYLYGEQRILEIGTGWGKSATAMALCNPNCTIDTVDTGEFQIACGWAKDQDDYLKKVYRLFYDFDVDKQITIRLSDWMKYEPREQYDAIHIDAIASMDYKCLERFVPYLNSGGFIFIRNYFRFKEQADSILSTFQYFDHSEFIQVVAKE